MILRLTTANGPRGINTEYIRTLSPNPEGGTVITVGDEPIVVQEDFHTIMADIETQRFREYVGHSM